MLLGSILTLKNDRASGFDLGVGMGVVRASKAFTATSAGAPREECKRSWTQFLHLIVSVSCRAKSREVAWLIQ